MADDKLTIEQFGQKIKEKHPEYKDMQDSEVGQKVLGKFPQYGDMIQPASTGSATTSTGSATGEEGKQPTQPKASEGYNWTEQLNKGEEVPHAAQPMLKPVSTMSGGFGSQPQETPDPQSLLEKEKDRTKAYFQNAFSNNYDYFSAPQLGEKRRDDFYKKMADNIQKAGGSMDDYAKIKGDADKWFNSVGQIKLATEKLKENPNDLGAKYAIAAHQTELGNYGEAAKGYEDLIKKNPKFGSAYTGLAYLYGIKGRDDLSIMYMDEAIENNPNDAMLYGNRAVYNQRTGDYAKAYDDINKGLELADKTGDDQLKLRLLNQRFNINGHLSVDNPLSQQYNKLAGVDKATAPAGIDQKKAVEQHRKDYNDILQLENKIGKNEEQQTIEKRKIIDEKIKNGERISIDDVPPSIELAEMAGFEHSRRISESLDKLMHKQDLEHLTMHPIDTMTDYAKEGADVIIAGADKTVEGLKQVANGTVKMNTYRYNEGVEDVTKGFLKGASGLIESGLGVVTHFTPEGVLFVAGTKAASPLVGGDEVVNALMAPLQTFLNPTSETGKNLAGIGDAVLQGLLMHASTHGIKGTEELAKKIADKKPLEKEDIATYVEAGASLKKEDWEDLAKKNGMKVTSSEPSPMASTGSATGENMTSLKSEFGKDIEKLKKSKASPAASTGSATGEGGTAVIVHPESVDTEKGLVNTNDTDNPELTNDKLTDKGKEEAKNIDLTGKKKIFISPNERTKETAELARKDPGTEIVESPLLKTGDVSGFEKTPEKDFDEAKWLDSKDGQEFTGRMQQAWKLKQENPDAAFVTHSKVEKALNALDKTNGVWNEEAKREYLTSSPGFDKLSQQRGKEQPAPYITSDKKYTVEKSKEGLKIVNNETGEAPSESVQEKVKTEYEDNFDYAQGERAMDKAEREKMDFSSPEESEKYIAQHSANPNELIDAYQRSQDFKDEKSYKEQILDEMPFKVNQKSYERFGDPNNVGMTMAKRFFQKEGWGLDQVSEHATEAAGVEITPQDVVDFMENDKYQRKISPLTRDIMNRFKEVTGMNLNERVVEKSHISESEKRRSGEAKNTAAQKKEEKYLNKQYKSYEEAEREFYEAIERGEIPIDESEAIGIEGGKEKVPVAEKEGRGAGGNVEGEKKFYKPKDGLSDADRKVETDFGNKLASDMEGATKEYWEIPQTRGNILNTDYARELSDDYKKNPLLTDATQNPASAFVKKIFDDEIEKPVPEGKDKRVIWTSGGSGSAKSSSLEGAHSADKVHLVVDSNLARLDVALYQINKALENGHIATINYIYRDPVQAFLHGVMQRHIESGHNGPPVSIDVTIGTAKKSLDVIKKISEHYKDNKNVEFNYFDNSYAKNEAKIISLKDVQKLEINRTLAEKEIRDELKKKYDGNKLTKEQYEELSGEKTEGLQRQGTAGNAKETIGKTIPGRLPSGAEQSEVKAIQELRKGSILEPELAEVNEKKSTYKTKGGEEIPFTSLRENKDLSDKGTSTTNTRRKAGGALPKTLEELNPNEVCWMERQLSEKKSISLTGPTKIKSTSDVAYLFRHLEDAATENTFAVLKKKDGSYNALYLGTGSTTGSLVDIKLLYAAAKDFKADSISFVHNHPSGVLKPSDADYAIHKKIKSSFEPAGIKVDPSVIINLDSGKYVEFSDYGAKEEIRPTEIGKEKQIKTFEFEKQKLYTPSSEKTKINNSEDTAKFLSQQKRGSIPKLGIIVLSNDMKINRYVMEDGLLSDKELFDKVLYNVGKSGESAILVSNDKFDTYKIQNLQDKLLKSHVRLQDAIEVTDHPDITNNYKSFADEGMLNEPPEKYDKEESDYEKGLRELAQKAKAKGVQTAEQFAKLIDEPVDDAIRKAWASTGSATTLTGLATDEVTKGRRHKAEGEQPTLFPETPEEAAQKADNWTHKESPKVQFKSFVQTVQRGAETTEGLKEKMKEVDQFYETMKNKDTLKRVDREIAKDLGAVKDKVLSDETPTADKSAMAVRLIKHYESQKDYDAALEIIENYDKQLREAGQFIQAASLWNKLAPETIVRTAKKISKKYGKEMSPEDQKFVLQRMTEIGKMEEGAEKDKATLEVLNFVADKIPHTAKELFDAYRYQNMLSNPRSHMRNIANNFLNVFITRPLDILGEATYDILRHPFNPAARDASMSDIPGYMKEAVTMIPNAWEAAKQAYKEGYVADKIMEIDKTTTMIETLRKTKLPKYLTVAMRLMEAQDRFFSILIAQGEKTRLLKNGMENAEAEAKAKKTGERYLYREKLGLSKNDQNIFSQALDSIGNGVMGIRKWPIVGKASEWFIPFVTTPINVAKLGVEHSPLGFVGGKYGKEQLSSATLGTIISGAGAMLAMQDRTTWAPPSDKKEKELFYASGRKPYSIKIGNEWVPMNYFGPFAIAMGLPAALKHYQQDTKESLTDNEFEIVGETIMSNMKFITSQTPMSGVGGFFKVIDGEDDYTVGKTAGFTATQIIPLTGMVKYINTIYDPIFRKSSGFVESVEKDLPELSKQLPAYKEPTGEPVEREPVNYFLPYDLGFTKEEYEIQLKNRRALLQKLAPQKERAKERIKEKERNK